MNLFTNLTTILSSEVLLRIATYIDEPIEKTSKAVDGLVYTIVGGLMKRTTSEIGVTQLYNHIQKGRYDGALLTDLAAVLRDPALTNTLITQGNDVISHLLPAMKSSISSMISGYAGIRNSSAISLLGLLTTIVLQALGKQVKEQKLDANGLASTLFAEREAFVNIVPEEFMPRLVEKVGLHQIVAGLAAPARRPTVESTGRTITTATRPAISYDMTDESDKDNGALTKWGVGALIALALAFGGYYLYQNTQKYSDGQTGIADSSTTLNDTIQADTVTRSLAVPKEQAIKTAPKSTSITSAVSTTGVTAIAPSNLTQQMTPYLGNASLPKGRVFTLTGVAYQPGSMTMTIGSAAIITELATILKTYPQLQIQLVGYANDGWGSITNKSLSFKRVNQIKQQLMASGINFMRIDAIGLGTGIAPSIARNDTSAIKRPTLRKIDLKVVVK